MKELADFTSRATGYVVPPNKAIVGDYAFSHESGIHTHGVLSNPLTYEPYPPELVRNRRRLTIGKQSGRAIVARAVSNIAASAVQETVFFIPMLCIGLWFIRAMLTVTGIILGLAATMVSVAALAQLGAIFTSLTLRYRQVTAIFGFFNFAFQMLTGMFIPLQLLPIPLQIIGQSLPQTFGMDLLRYYVMKTTPIMVVDYEWIILLGQFLVLCVIAKLAIVYLERTAKEQGLHYI